MQGGFGFFMCNQLAKKISNTDTSSGGWIDPLPDFTKPIAKSEAGNTPT